MPNPIDLVTARGNRPRNDVFDDVDRINVPFVRDDVLYQNALQPELVNRSIASAGLRWRSDVVEKR